MTKKIFMNEFKSSKMINTKIKYKIKRIILAVSILQCTYGHQSRRSQMASLAQNAPIFIHWTFRFVFCTCTKYIFLVIVCARKFPYNLKLETFALINWDHVFHNCAHTILFSMSFTASSILFSLCECWMCLVFETNWSTLIARNDWVLYRTISLIGIFSSLFLLLLKLIMNSLWTLLEQLFKLKPISLRPKAPTSVFPKNFFSFQHHSLMFTSAISSRINSYQYHIWFSVFICTRTIIFAWFL